MKASGDLFDLVKSLEQSEKRYFKIFATMHFKGSDNKYLILFDAIDAQDKYNEDAIKKKFANEKFVKQLHVAKNYLYNTILKALRLYTSEKSKIHELKGLIRDIEILYEKSLYSQCRKLIERAKKLAIDYERYSELSEIFDLEKSLARSNAYAGVEEKDLEDIYKEQNEVLDKLKNINDFWRLSTKAFFIRKKYGVPRKKEEIEFYKNLFNDPLLKKKSNASTYISKSIYHNIKGLYYHTIKDQKNLLKECENMIELMESNEYLMKRENYTSALYNLLIVQIETGNFSEALKTIKKMREIETNSESLKTKIFVTSYDTEINVYLKSGDFEKGIALIPEISNGLSEYKNKINQEAEIAMYYNIAYLYFGEKMFDRSLEWVNKILNTKKLSLREDIKCYSRILNLLIHSELENFDLVDYEMKSTQRFLVNHNHFGQNEKLIMEMLRVYIKKEPIERKSVLDEYLHKFTRRKGGESDGDYFDFKAWIRSKISGEKMSSEIKKLQR